MLEFSHFSLFLYWDSTSISWTRGHFIQHFHGIVVSIDFHKNHYFVGMSSTSLFCTNIRKMCHDTPWWMHSRMFHIHHSNMVCENICELEWRQCLEFFQKNTKTAKFEKIAMDILSFRSFIPLHTPYNIENEHRHCLPSRFFRTFPSFVLEFRTNDVQLCANGKKTEDR